MVIETNVDDDVRLECSSPDATGQHFELSYSIANGGRTPIFVANGLFHRRGAAGFEVDPNLVYAEVSDDSVLRICKQVIVVPEGVSVEAPEVPYFSRLDPDGELSERLQLAIPIELRYPYRRPTSASSSTTAERVTFSIGYVPVDDELDAKEMTLAGGAQYWWMSYSNAIRRQRLKTYGPVGARVKVAVPREP